MFLGFLTHFSGKYDILNKKEMPEDEPLQTNIKSSLMWSEKETFEGYDEEFIPGLVERLSFAAYQSVSGDKRSFHRHL